MSEIDELFAMLEGKGLAAVRQELAQGIYSERRKSLVQGWVDAEERENAARTAATTDAREERTLQIARAALDAALKSNNLSEKANEIANRGVTSAVKSANAAEQQARWAKWAAMIAAVMALAAAHGQLLKLWNAIGGWNGS